MGQVFSVRRMCPGDIPAAAAIEAVVPDGWSARAISEYAAMDASRCFVAASGQGVCGFAAFTCAAGEANLDALSVAAHTRRCGVARALLDAAFRDLREEGAACIFLEVRTQNAPARALYTSLGFTQTGVRKGFYKNPADDAVLMKKPL
ncbi:MAG: ribosomal protein S18-alanine N-acetyltransferase [Ruthenibacterium sp.]